MTTESPSDTVPTSHGSADPGAVLAWDDDRGSVANPASCESCSPASTAVRHKDGNASGAYSVGVTTRADDL